MPPDVNVENQELLEVNLFEDLLADLDQKSDENPRLEVGNGGPVIRPSSPEVSKLCIFLCCFNIH